MQEEFYQLLRKAERFCAYQERCRHDVKNKLLQLRATSIHYKEIISVLEENNYLNEERFAKHFTSGKFRIKKWGKNKISAELRKKKIPKHFIEMALDEIKEEEYLQTIRYQIKKKEQEYRARNPEERRKKIYRFLLSKGFEPSYILAAYHTFP